MARAIQAQKKRNPDVCLAKYSEPAKPLGRVEAAIGLDDIQISCRLAMRALTALLLAVGEGTRLSHVVASRELSRIDFHRLKAFTSILPPHRGRQDSVE